MIKTILQLIDIFKLALSLYKKYEYNTARKKLISILEEKDDKKTADYLDDLLK